MDKLTEIKEKLDKLYEEYKKKGSNLSNSKSNEVVLLLAKMTGVSNTTTKSIAEQLSRFPAAVCQMYFDTLTKTAKPNIKAIDDLLRDFLETAGNTRQPQHVVKRFANTIITVVKSYKEYAFESKALSSLVAYNARYAVNSEKYMEFFRNIVNKTDGVIYLLDYSNIDNSSMKSIWEITNVLFPDISKVKYESFITEWGTKYDFITPTKTEEPVSTDNKVQIEESIVVKEMPKEEASAAMQPPIKTESVIPTLKKKKSKVAVTKDDISEKKEKPATESVLAKEDTPVEKPIAVPESKKADVSAGKSVSVHESKKADVPVKKPVVNVDENASNNTSEAAVSENTPAKKGSAQVLYDRLKRDMNKEQEAIITAFTDMITPVGKAFKSIQGEISKSREIGAENVTLKTKITDLDRQLSEQRNRLQTANQSLTAARTENDELKKQISSLEVQNAELDSKLNDAYAINSRESSLEAEKIRSELKKTFTFLYEDWLEYEFSDVSEENYESLQAIIKKIFRSLERNGIDFKGDN